MKIAAFVDDQGVPVSLYRAGTIQVYEDVRNDDGPEPARRWQAGARHAFLLEPAMSLEQVKAAVADLVAALDADCRLLLSGEIRGLPYSVLQEHYGFRNWKSEGPLEAQLDHLRRRETEIQAKKKYELVLRADQSVPAPVLVDGSRGHYWIDLRAALDHEANPTSRQILIPFLKAGAFSRLEVLCGHLPRWMAWELTQLGYSADSEPIDACDDGLRVTIHSPRSPGHRQGPLALAGAPLLALPGCGSAAAGGCRRASTEIIDV